MRSSSSARPQKAPESSGPAGRCRCSSCGQGRSRRHREHCGFRPGKPPHRDVEMPVIREQERSQPHGQGGFLSLVEGKKFVGLAGGHDRTSSLLKEYKVSVLSLANEQDPALMVCRILEFIGVKFDSRAHPFTAVGKEDSRNYKLTILGSFSETTVVRTSLPVLLELPDEIPDSFPAKARKIAEFGCVLINPRLIRDPRAGARFQRRGLCSTGPPFSSGPLRPIFGKNCLNSKWTPITSMPAWPKRWLWWLRELVANGPGSPKPTAALTRAGGDHTGPSDKALKGSQAKGRVRRIMSSCSAIRRLLRSVHWTASCHRLLGLPAWV